MRIRQGNDFIFLWAIERNELPEDLGNAKNIRLHFKNFDCVGRVQSFQIVDGNIVRVEVSPEWASRLGAYRLILSYEFEDQSYSDGDQKCVVDVLAFNIVPKTSEADDVTEMAKTTDIMIGFQGLSAYEVWLKDNPDKTKEDYYNWLQEPATDIAETVGLQEQARVEAEELRVLAEQDRQTNTATAISNAENATENANTAAQNADNARLAIQDDLALKANHGYESDPKTLKEVDDDLIQLAGDVSQKQSIVVDYTHTGNKELNIESIDFATGTITAAGHGLAVNTGVYVINKGMGNFPFSALPNGLNPLNKYFVKNVTPNTFQLSLSVTGDEPITISDKATKDYSQWHFEVPGDITISNLSLRKFTVEFEGKSSGEQFMLDYFILTGGRNYGGAGALWIMDAERTGIASGLGRPVFKSMANGDIWSYNRLDVDVTGKRASILINGYRIYSLTETTREIIRHNNEVAVHSSVGEDVVTSFKQNNVFNGMNIKVTKIL